MQHLFQIAHIRNKYLDITGVWVLVIIIPEFYTFPYIKILKNNYMYAIATLFGPLPAFNWGIWTDDDNSLLPPPPPSPLTPLPFCLGIAAYIHTC